MAYYRPLGFFQDFADLSDAELAVHLEDLEATTGFDFDPLELTADLHILRWDTRRVWSEDPGLDIAPEQKAYERTIAAWADISRGAFRPERVTERWDGPEGPIWLELLVEGQGHAVEALHQPFMLDLEIVKDVNLILGHPELRLYLSEGIDEIVSVMALFPEERVAIERDRGLAFHIHDLKLLFGAAASLLERDAPAPGRLAGTMKESLERSAGRLHLVREDRALAGTYTLEVGETRRRFVLRGLVDPETGLVGGGLEGELDAHPFEGIWQGKLSPDGWFAWGEWGGWVRGRQKERTWEGTFGALAEAASEDPYVEALAAWLGEVWRARSLLESPLTLV